MDNPFFGSDSGHLNCWQNVVTSLDSQQLSLLSPPHFFFCYAEANRNQEVMSSVLSLRGVNQTPQEGYRARVRAGIASIHDSQYTSQQ